MVRVMDADATWPSARAARAHALKNCLAVIAAINRLVEPEVCERTRERIERSQDAVRLELLQEDLAADRPGCAGDSTLVCVEEVLRRVVARVQDLAHLRAVTLLVQVEGGGIVADAVEIVEALANLVLNAVEATPRGGSVVVAIREFEDGSQVWTVRDTGPGIPAQVQRRLGAPFVVGRSGGSGLGFAVAHRTFQRHGGQLEVRSTCGAGTEISVRFPRPRIEEGAPMESPEEGESRG
jgi:two-component system phosphate regulon sensor histidine kinase PhoR